MGDGVGEQAMGLQRGMHWGWDEAGDVVGDRSEVGDGDVVGVPEPSPLTWQESLPSSRTLAHTMVSVMLPG